MKALPLPVDVVIPWFNQPHLLISLLESLRPQPRVSRIILMDDFSDPIAHGIIENMVSDNISLFKNPERKGFIYSVNKGIAKNSQSEYVLILNSDTVAREKAIQRMAQNLDDGADVCGALLIYPEKHRQGLRVQHAGIGFDYDGVPFHPFMGYHHMNPAVVTWRNLNAVTGACMMVRRSTWDKIGGFDRKYGVGVFEDVDYCLAVKKIGGAVVYEPTAVWEHWMHGSQVDADHWFTQDHINVNLSILFTKFGQPRCDAELFFKCRHL